jgi:hypothetical protein
LYSVLPKVKLKGRVIGKEPSSSPVIVDILHTSGVFAWVAGRTKNIIVADIIGSNSR